MISRFSVIVFVDADNGMSKDGSPPISPPSWRKFFKDKTCGTTSVDATGKRSTSAVIMGRRTFEMFKQSSDKDHLPNRQNYVISKTYQQQDFSNVIVYKSLLNCLVGIAGLTGVRVYERVWIIGGERLIREALSRYLCYCDKVYVGKLRNETIGCDLSFSTEELRKRNVPLVKEMTSNEYDIISYEPKVEHQESQYLRLLTDCLNGDVVREKCGQTEEVFLKVRNRTLTFDLRVELPLITTREIDHAKIVQDLVDDLGGHFKSDSLGFRMRCARFTGPKDYEIGGDDDQLTGIVEKLSTTRNAALLVERRVETEFFSPAIVKFEVDRKYLMCSVYFCRCEIFKYLPYYITYLALLASAVAATGGWISSELHVSICDALLSDKYKEFAKKQMRYDPKPWPKLTIKNTAEHSTICDYTRDNFSIQNYESWIKLNIDKASV